MKSFLILIVITCVAILSGCAGRVQPPVALDQGFWQKESPRIGVFLASPHKAEAHILGADCLLCLAAATIANTGLINYMPTLSVDDMLNLETELADTLNAQGLIASVIDEGFSLRLLRDTTLPTGAKKDFTGWSGTFDYLMIVDVTLLGTQRTYSGYIPTSDPQAVVRGQVYMVDLSNNQYVLFEAFHNLRAVDGEWDEAPAFPGVTNAYFQAVESSKDNIKGLVTKARCRSCTDTPVAPAVAPAVEVSKL